MKSNLSLYLLQLEVTSLNFKLDDSGALMAFEPSSGINHLRDCPSIMSAILEISSIRNQEPLHLMINILKPGVKVPIHRDWIHPTKYQSTAPTVERWHLPIQTNKDALFWTEEKGTSHMSSGYWYGPFPYWKKHQVWNSGVEDRVHIVVDLNTPQPLGSYED